MGGGGWVVAWSILVSAQGPLVLGLGLKAKGFGAKGLGPGLDKSTGSDPRVSSGSNISRQDQHDQ